MMYIILEVYMRHLCSKTKEQHKSLHFPTAFMTSYLLSLFSLTVLTDK